jgi:hypothetical protein
MREYVCQENNRDAADAEGRPSMNLGLDDPDDPFGPPAVDAKKSGQSPSWRSGGSLLGLAALRQP